MSLPSRQTYDLAKAFYNIENAAKLFDSILAERNVAGSTKKRLTDYAARCRWIIQDMIHTLELNGYKDSAKLMREQLRTWETLSFESVFDEMVLMDDVKREGFELVAKAYRTGEIQWLKTEEV